jgi:nitrogen-specific signal transduction histidine kinase
VSENLTSLLNFLDAPLMIGDPDGRVVWVNPAFESTFDCYADGVRGQPLAMLFDGGGREAVLSAVAQVCARSETVRFRLKRDGKGLLGVCSPIEAEGGSVGVVILLTLEPDTDERLLAYQAEIAEPLDEAVQILDELMEQTGGRRAERYRVLVERGLGALHRAQKWSDELRGALAGQRSTRAQSSVDPVKVVRRVAQHVIDDGAHAGPKLQLLVPASLPPVLGDATMLETALLRLVRSRGLEAGGEAWLSLSARAAGHGADRRVFFSVVDRRFDDPAAFATEAEEEAEPKLVRAAVSALGGELVTWGAPPMGRVTTIALQVIDAG